MNKLTRRTAWKAHFFPLGVAFFITGCAALLDVRQLIVFDPWRLAALAVVVVGLFISTEIAGKAGLRESLWICVIGLWISAGILRLGGLNLLALYPALVALTGLYLLLGDAARRIARSRTEPTV
jgi:hypothetical protein